jgi:3-oxoacyl-[acyl-carrier protein] reductase
MNDVLELAGRVDASGSISRDQAGRPRSFAGAGGLDDHSCLDTFWSPPGMHMLNYVASKGALIGMAHTLAVGLGSDGIAVTAVAPGLTRTPATGVVPPTEFADTEARQALRRPLTPDDTAGVVATLARDEAAALTGQTLTVDGGLVMR